ncbi:MAG: hypothetical protein EBU52_14915, partial [Cytophagia bacterium]|nr:hypothetical protein [Cytophagia bacterium]
MTARPAIFTPPPTGFCTAPLINAGSIEAGPVSVSDPDKAPAPRNVAEIVPVDVVLPRAEINAIPNPT